MAMLQVEKKLIKEPRESHDTQLYHKLQPVSKGGPTTISVPGFPTARKTLPYEPTNHKSVDYRAFKRGFQASRKPSQSLHIALIK